MLHRATGCDDHINTNGMFEWRGLERKEEEGKSFVSELREL